MCRTDSENSPSTPQIDRSACEPVVVKFVKGTVQDIDTYMHERLSSVR